jgi:membrane-associated phospholipid phosphatase
VQNGRRAAGRRRFVAPVPTGVGLRHPGAVAALGSALAGFALVAAQVVAGSAGSWDHPAMRLVNREVGSIPTPISAGWILEGGIVLGAAVALGTGVALAASGRVRHAIFWAASIAGVAVLDPTLKALFHRPGVGGNHDYSFPSGTAMVSMAAAAALLALARPGPTRFVVVVLGAVGTIAAGLSVVYVDWHYPSDVLAGWCIAVAWVSALWLALVARAPSAAAANSSTNGREEAPCP